MQKQKQTFIKRILTVLTVSTAALSSMAYGATAVVELPVSGPCVKKTWAMGNPYKVGDVVSTSPFTSKNKPSKNYVFGYDGMGANKLPLTEEGIKNANRYSPRIFPAVWKEISPPKTRCAPPTEYVGVLATSISPAVKLVVNTGSNVWPVMPPPPRAIKPLVKDFVLPSETLPAAIKIDPKTDDSFSALLPEKLFILMFPNRHEVYTYEGLQSAYNYFREFAGVGDPLTRKRELAAFLANVAHETGGLVYAEQYTSGTDNYCKPVANFPCSPEARYFGRGAMQITWNNVYGRFIRDLNPQMPDKDFQEIYKSPDNVVTSGAGLVWSSAVWYWMNVKGYSNFTAHQAMIHPAGGFGGTIAAINGKAECNGQNPEQAKQRIVNYQIILDAMGLPPTVDTKLECFIPTKEIEKKDDASQGKQTK